MNSPISWLGGKRSLLKKILPLIPEHRVYIEVFAGAAWVLFAKKPSRVEIINDINGELVNMYRMIQRHSPEIIRCLRFKLQARDEFNRLRFLAPLDLTEVERAVRMFFLIKTSFGSKRESYGTQSNGRVLLNHDTYPTVLAEAGERLKRVNIENRDFKDLIARYDDPEAFMYLDPPYWGCENDYGKLIWNRSDFGVLNEILSAVKGKFLLSLNDRPEIREIFKQFDISEVEARYSIAVNQNQKASELFIKNY